MRRFYKEALARADGAVTLDGKPVKTPAKAALRLPSPALAAAVAAEWQAQGDVIDPHSMPLTKLANTAIDRVSAERNVILSEMVDYAGSDLLCYRAEFPPDLLALQARLWDPVLAWAADELGVAFDVTHGLMHRPQPSDALRALGQRLAGHDDFAVAGLHTLTIITGSALLALMVGEGASPPEAAWEAANADEDYQVSHWGWDDEAQSRRARRLVEFQAACRFIGLVKHR